MNRNVARGPVRQSVAVTGATRAAAFAPQSVTRQTPIMREPDLADIQDDTPAKNDTGVPTTPIEETEGREEEMRPGMEEHKGAVMNWFDELGS